MKCVHFITQVSATGYLDTESLRLLLPLRKFSDDPRVPGYYYIITCRCLCVTYRRVLDRMLGFIDTLYTVLGTTGNYSASVISTHFTVHSFTRTNVLSLH
jgi:hypothetical protein